MSSPSGFALAPKVEITVPFTVTRPSSMNLSAARLEATPAAAMIFCIRIPSSLGFIAIYSG
jgi:hypothetical protein